MTEESRGEWLAMAWDTLKHLPPDILAEGARKARQSCDHPSKIVPTIISETKERMSWRQGVDHDSAPPLQLPRPDYCTPEEAAQILRELGLKRNPLTISPTGGR
jgi:hypothetical protein